MKYIVEVTGKRIDGSDYRLVVNTVAESSQQAQEMVERDYDWENARSMNISVVPAL